MRVEIWTERYRQDCRVQGRHGTGSTYMEDICAKSDDVCLIAPYICELSS